MADPSHLDILKEGVEAWNEWRTQNPSITPDLTAAHLLMADLSGANLSHANLSEAMLAQADLTRANLTDANLSGADLTAANLTQLQINEANGDKTTQLPEGLKRPAAWSQT
jgi:uncharacterized protein YjbI with pentapeptide repeats